MCIRNLNSFEGSELDAGQKSVLKICDCCMYLSVSGEETTISYIASSNMNNHTKVPPSSKFIFWNNPLKLTSITLWLPAINVNHVVLQTSTNLAVFLVFILNVYNLKLNVLVAVASVLDIFVLPSLVSIFRYIFPNSFSIYHDCYQVHVLSLPKSYWLLQ